jgi:hypothetical protein
MERPSQELITEFIEAHPTKSAEQSIIVKKLRATISLQVIRL